MAAPFEGMNGDARPESDEIEADAPWIGDGDGDPNNRRVEEKSREGRRRLEENFNDGVKSRIMSCEEDTSLFRSNLKHTFPSKAPSS